MKQLLGIILETLKRVQAFLDGDSRFAAINQSIARQRLDELVAKFTKQAVDQETGSREAQGETARQATLRKALRKHYMGAVASAAELKLRDVPEFATLTLPPFDVPMPEFLTAADAMAQTARKYEATLVEAGLPAGYLGVFETATATLRKSLDVRSTHVGRRIGATGGLEVHARDARKIVNLLDSLVGPAIGTDPTLLAQWKTVKHIPRKPGPVTGNATPSATTAATSAPTPAPTPAAHPAVAVPVVPTVPPPEAPKAG